MVSAMHVLWPFLLFLTHFVTCSFYPWTTAAVVLLLDISLIAASLRRICSDISSALFNFRDYIMRMLSFEWLTTSRVFRSTCELASATGIFDGGNSEEVRPSATPVIQPRFTVDAEYRSSEAPVIQPREAHDEHTGPSQTPVIQPRKAAEETYRPSETPRIQPQLTPEKPHGPSETPVIQPRVDFTSLHKASQAPKIQPRLDHISSQRESETPRMHPQMVARQPYRASEAPKIQPCYLEFDTMENCPHIGFSEDSGASTSKGSTGYSTSSRKSKSPRKTGGRNDGKETESKNFVSQIDDQNKYEDFSQELDWSKEEKKTSTPRKKRVEE
ncbi:hypothetical protein AVEN_159263-1 [Araneus ventricosus]|uniref:Uncharacterized protein n=1 Tax=Araneus ventricosus TaxID=182803 RepID=A0A4Y2A0X0_ARAVE|nr:hypothetical protein AVEN_159263-1 [Araneus ventricosus]